MTLTEDVSDNDSINLLVNNLINNATFSQHALNDYATKSNSLARRDSCTVEKKSLNRLLILLLRAYATYSSYEVNRNCIL